MVTWAPSQPLMYLTVPVPLICVTERICLAFSGGGFFLAGEQPSISETPRRSRVGSSALNAEHEKEEDSPRQRQESIRRF